MSLNRNSPLAARRGSLLQETRQQSTNATLAIEPSSLFTRMRDQIVETTEPRPLPREEPDPIQEPTRYRTMNVRSDFPRFTFNTGNINPAGEINLPEYANSSFWYTPPPPPRTETVNPPPTLTATPRRTGNLRPDSWESVNAGIQGIRSAPYSRWGEITEQEHARINRTNPFETYFSIGDGPTYERESIRETLNNTTGRNIGHYDKVTPLTSETLIEFIKNNLELKITTKKTDTAIETKVALVLAESGIELISDTDFFELD